MLLQNWDGDVRDLHAPQPWYRVRITHKKSKRVRIVELQAGMKFPVRDSIGNYSVENLGQVDALCAKRKK
jgi:hypothetical protein